MLAFVVELKEKQKCKHTEQYGFPLLKGAGVQGQLMSKELGEASWKRKQLSSGIVAKQMGQGRNSGGH